MMMLCRNPRRTAVRFACGAALILGVAWWTAAAEEGSRINELENRVAELERLLSELEAAGRVEPVRLDELERRIQVLASEIEDLKLGEAASPASESIHGLGPAASKVYGVERGVSIGGYGETLYENFDSSREDGSPSGERDELDFLRAIVYVGYKFNDRILFNSEIEFEHASTGRDGEVSVEFAYLDFLLREELNVRAGMVLVPMGFVNELHEPPVFLGARRPFVEQALIPSTWRENGAGVFGEYGPLSYRAYVVNGLAAVAGTSSEASGFSARGIRNGRSKGSKSAAEDLALVGRLDWAVKPWLSFGGSIYDGGAGQGQATPGGEPIDADTRLWEVHGEVRWRGLQGRALYASTDIEDVELINEAQGFTGSESVGERQVGWYGEIGFDLLSLGRARRQSLIPYLRYERFNTQDRVPAGFSADPANDVTVATLGVAWKPIVNVAIKLDYNRIENEARTGIDQINVGLGFLY